jgi:hypothetical protein
MVYYFNGRKLQIGLSTHETKNEKVVSGTRDDGSTILVSDSYGETIETTNGIDILGHDGIIIFESDGGTPLRDDTREGGSKNAHRRLSFIDIRGSIVENSVQLLDGDVTMFSVGGGIDASGKKSSLNNIFQGLLEITRKSVRTGLSDRIYRHGVILIVEIRNSLSGGSNESHL